MLSFVVAGLTCIFAALCYAEFASMVPVAGSAYTYAYATLGELLAWIIGWDLVLEYAVASSTVAHGWSHYFQDFLRIFGVHLPHVVTQRAVRLRPDHRAAGVDRAPCSTCPRSSSPLLVTIILVNGIQESATFNAAMVIVKLAVVLFVIVVGAFYVNPDNWTPFAPFGLTGISFFGNTLFGQTGPAGEPVGMLAGAAIVFFAYIGFDSVSTHAEEAKQSAARRADRHHRLAGPLHGALHRGRGRADRHGAATTRSTSTRRCPTPSAGRPAAGRELLISVGALAGITSVLLVMMLSQPRDPPGHGARRPAAARVLRRRPPAIPDAVEVDDPDRRLRGDRWPALLPLRILAELVNIGTLFAFVIVCAAVLIMRQDAPRGRAAVPRAARPARADPRHRSCCLLLMFSLPAENWVRLCGLAGPRARDLLRVRLPAQRAAQERYELSAATASVSSHRFAS